jgi:hypothetical protein
MPKDGKFVSADIAERIIQKWSAYPKAQNHRRTD